MSFSYRGGGSDCLELFFFLRSILGESASSLINKPSVIPHLIFIDFDFFLAV